MATMYEHLESKIKAWKALPQTPEITALIRDWEAFLREHQKQEHTGNKNATRDTMIAKL